MGPGEWRQRVLDRLDQERERRVAESISKIEDAMEDGCCEVTCQNYSHRDELAAVCEPFVERGFDFRIVHNGWSGGICFCWKAASGLEGKVEIDKNLGKHDEQPDVTSEWHINGDYAWTPLDERVEKKTPVEIAADLGEKAAEDDN